MIGLTGSDKEIDRIKKIFMIYSQMLMTHQVIMSLITVHFLISFYQMWV